MTDFKDHPPSIAELKAYRANDGSKWCPRDALIDLLRQIDRGANVDALVLCFRVRNHENDVGSVSYIQAAPDPCTAVGVWKLAGMRLMAGRPE